MLALIIWGTRTREKVFASGEFQCPTCQRQTPYTHKKLRRYFALYFIPIFPVATVSEWIDCAVCSGKFDLTALAAAPQLAAGQPQGPQQAPWGHPQAPPQQGAWGGPPQAPPQQGAWGGPPQAPPQQGAWGGPPQAPP
ncbi:MAG: zinc-ribbon domain-containing protein, partial [Polyangiaceae bacterium]